jgi:hypothetical protein
MRNKADSTPAMKPTAFMASSPKHERASHVPQRLCLPLAHTTHSHVLLDQVEADSVVRSVGYFACSVWDIGTTPFVPWQETEGCRTVLH